MVPSYRTTGQVKSDQTMTEAEKVFKKYTEPYTVCGNKIQMKTDHAMRVKFLCEDIADSLELDDHDLELASVCGLFHDIGRYEQWKRYNTYNDMGSVDHGDLGAEILEKDRLVDRFSDTGRSTILQAVRCHNKYRVPDTLGEKSRRFAGITRDADKIDIMDLYAGGELAGNTKGSAMSYPVFQALMDNKRIRKQDIVTKADEIAIRLAFVYDINYPRTVEIIKEHDPVNKMIDRQAEETSNIGLKKQLEQLRDHINGYMS